MQGNLWLGCSLQLITAQLHKTAHLKTIFRKSFVEDTNITIVYMVCIKYIQVFVDYYRHFRRAREKSFIRTWLSFTNEAKYTKQFCSHDLNNLTPKSTCYAHVIPTRSKLGQHSEQIKIIQIIALIIYQLIRWMYSFSMLQLYEAFSKRNWNRKTHLAF